MGRNRSCILAVAITVAFFFFFFDNVSVDAQQIRVFQSTHDQSKWFTDEGVVASFSSVSKGNRANPDIVVNEQNVYQQMDGFGAAITDSSAIALQQLKQANQWAYWALMNQLWNMTGPSSAALSHARVPLSSCDFSVSWYTYDDVSNNNVPDWDLTHFNIHNAPWQLWQTIKDAISVNPSLKIMFTPWSQPAWMKSPQQLNGGVVAEEFYGVYASYLARTMQEIARMGFGKNMWALSVQNEPNYQPSSYCGTYMDPTMQAKIGKLVRQALNAAGFNNITMLTLDHNWNYDTYPVQVFQQADGAFDGVAWHCYGGDPSQQQTFNQAYPNAQVHFTECTRLTGSSNEPWPNLRTNAQDLLIESVNYGSQTVTLWNAVLDTDGNGNTGPHLPNVCADCLAPVLISNQNYALTSDWATLAQGSAATKPCDVGGPFAKRIGATSNNPNLILTAFRTERSSAAKNRGEQPRWSLVVLNWDDNYENGPYITIDAVIQWRGRQATVSLPVGVSTIYWYDSE